MFVKHYAPNRCEPSIEALIFFFFFFFLGGGGGGGEWGDQGRYEQRSEVFVKFQKKKYIFFFLGGGGGGGGGVRVDVNGEVKFL